MTILIIGAVSLTLATILYFVVQRAVANQPAPAWASGTMCAQVHCIAITAFGGGGLIFVVGGLFALFAKAS